MDKNIPIWRQIIIPLILIIIFVIAVWGVLRMQASSVQPSLSASIPPTYATKESNIKLTGKTTPQANLTVNGIKVKVNSKGDYSDQISLKPGKNTVVIKAKKNSSKTTTITSVVTRNIVVAKVPASVSPSVKTVSPTTPVVNKGTLATTGPDQNAGFVGLAGIIISLYIYRKTKKKNRSQNPSYKIFTGEAI